VAGYVIMTNGQSYGMAPAPTDADGTIEFSNVPNGVVVLRGDGPGSYQPCAALAWVSAANGVKDIEVVDSAAVRPETVTGSPRLSGIVYRKTGAGKEPVAGAVIEYEYPPVVAATTITDAQGRYALCNLPPGRGGLDVWQNGVYFGGVVVNVIGDEVLDLNF
jgi:hypothetical protein